MEMEFGVHSDPGCVRENNEDCYGSAPEISLFVLSDGMGGLASGEVASRLAVDTVIEHCRRAEMNPQLPLVGSALEGMSKTSNRLASGTRLANEVVHREAQQNAGNGSGPGMGATIVAVRVFEDCMSLAHVGDSRAYRLRDGGLEQLTGDHSFVAEQVRRGRMTQQEAGNSTLQNVLIRALGVDSDVEVDVREDLVAENDTMLLCSDGLTRELSDAQIAAVLAETDDVQECAHRLVDLAKQAGGEDNITAFVIRPAMRPVGAFARVSKWFRDLT